MKWTDLLDSIVRLEVLHHDLLDHESWHLASGRHGPIGRRDLGVGHSACKNQDGRSSSDVRLRLRCLQHRACSFMTVAGGTELWVLWEPLSPVLC